MDVRPRTSTALDLPGLLRRCSAGEVKAWEELAARIQGITGAVLGRGFAKLRRVEKEEVEGDVLERLARVVRTRQIRAETNGEVVDYVKRVVINRARDLLKDRHRVWQPGDQLEQLVDSAARPDRAAQIRAQVEAVRAAMESWPPVDRFVFMLKFHGEPAEQIQTEIRQQFSLFIDPKTVDTKYLRLRRKLRSALNHSR